MTHFTDTLYVQNVYFQHILMMHSACFEYISTLQSYKKNVFRQHISLIHSTFETLHSSKACWAHAFQTLSVLVKRVTETRSYHNIWGLLIIISSTWRSDVGQQSVLITRVSNIGVFSDTITINKTTTTMTTTTTTTTTTCTFNLSYA